MQQRAVSFDDLTAAPNWDDVCKAYAQEGGNPEFGEPEVDVEHYKRMEAAGLLHVEAVFAEGGALVGFVTGLPSPYPHFSHIVMFAVDALWVRKDYRKRGVGMRLIRAVQRRAKALHCNGVLFGAKNGSDAYRLYMRLFKPMNTLFWGEV